MAYKVVFRKSALKAFEKYIDRIQPARRARALEVVESLAVSPRSGIGAKHMLKGSFNRRWACSVTPSARLLYHIEDDVLVVDMFDFSVDHYRDV